MTSVRWFASLPLKYHNDVSKNVSSSNRDKFRDNHVLSSNKDNSGLIKVSSGQKFLKKNTEFFTLFKGSWKKIVQVL
jgi:hypothetical protein